MVYTLTMHSFAFILFSAYLELLGFIGTPRLYKPGTIDLPIAISSQLDSKGGNHHQTVRLRLPEDTRIYAAPHPQLHSEMSPNLACGGAKGFSHPPTTNMTSSIWKLKVVLRTLGILIWRHRGDF